MYKIPYGTLQDRLRGQYPIQKVKLGRKPIFCEAKEQEIAATIIDMSNAFFGLTPTQIRQLVYKYAINNNIQNTLRAEKQICRKDWLYLFIKRHPFLSFRKPEKRA